jgi:general secretion pathway protein D
VAKFTLHAEASRSVIPNVLEMRRKAVVCLVIGMICALAAAASQASNLYKEGRKAERKGEMARAYLLYSQAAALAPEKNAYWLKSQAVRTRAALQSKIAAPVEAGGADVELPAESEPPDPITGRDLSEARKPLPPVELEADPGRKNFDIKAAPRLLFEQVARAFGLDVVFDGDYPESAPSITFRIDDADYREALRALEAATSSFVAPVTTRVFLVAKDNPQKRNDVEPAVTVVVSIPQTVTVQEAQELARAVQQVMEIRRFGIDSGRRLVLLNGPISKIRPAQRLFEDLLSYRPEVSVELQFIEVTRSEVSSFGLQLPTSFPIIPLTDVLHNTPSIPTGLSYLLTFGGGASVFGVGISDAQLIARFNKSNARTLLKSNIRSVDGLPATFHVGDRYPILTSGYFGPANFGGANAYRPPPSFNFEDLGLSVKMTPRIHGMEEVTLEIDAEFKVITGEALNGIPIISNRKLTSRVRLKNDEYAVIAGMMTINEARAISGLAGLAQIPGLGALVRRNEKTKDSDEVIIVIKPRLLSLPPDEIVTRSVWVGTDTRPRIPL